MIQPGSPSLLGSNCVEGGTNFAVYAPKADRLEVGLYNGHGQATGHHDLPECADGVWHGFLPGIGEGQRYGFRAHGAWAPEQGLRFNPAKLLLDPYARRLSGGFQFSERLFDYASAPDANGHGEWAISEQDSAPAMPLSVVAGRKAPAPWHRPAIDWVDQVLYEANVRGMTMRFPGLDNIERGKFRGLSHRQVLAHLKALGITSVELMPVHTLFDEPFLQKQGLRNFWGYNSIQYFTPDWRFADTDPVAEFRDMVRSIHDAGIEVVLDVVYNHTAEGDGLGATLSFRGLDNLGYYRTEPSDPARYINDTGCGNTLNADNPQFQQLVLDSLAYWHQDMGVDGFRFDLATILGRSASGFRSDHPLLQAIADDSRLRGVRLIAEPWDPGPGGYQVGAFHQPWSEMNDRYRDTLRRFWRGDDGQAGELARRLHGSADLVEHKQIGPSASVNFITAHDGFTLMDMVSYNHRHNGSNGENNRDGHAHNFSANYGTEGPSDDPHVNRLRRRQRLNLLASLLFSQGTPFLLAGDEVGNSQGGNNNAYSQDNETGWVDWSGLQDDPGFIEQVALLIRLRKDHPMVNLPQFLHGETRLDPGILDIAWLRGDGHPMNTDDWSHGKVFALRLTHHSGCDVFGRDHSVLTLFNASEAGQLFRLPVVKHPWRIKFCSADNAVMLKDQVTLPGRSIMFLTQGEDPVK